MRLSPEFDRTLALAHERLFQKCKRLRAEHAVGLGETSAPGTATDDPAIGKTNTEWTSWLEPENGRVDELIHEALAGAPPTDPAAMARLGDDNLWLWGGPTPYWGGSSAADTLVRAADYFGAKNGVYVYGPTTDEMLSLHGGFARLLCQVNSACRSPGAQEGLSNEQNAERLSELSLRHPNIRGAMLDDVISDAFDRLVLPDDLAAMRKALRKHNDRLDVYGVIYVRELDRYDLSLAWRHLDVVNLWFWRKTDILRYDEKIEQCRELSGGKPILSGVFLHDYGLSDAGAPPELLCHQLDRARAHIAKGTVSGVVLLGDRDIRKWPATARAIRDYLARQ